MCDETTWSYLSNLSSSLCDVFQTSPQQSSKHPRRLSSTPFKTTIENQRPLPDPASILVQSSSTQDDSLEDALFDKNAPKTVRGHSLPSPRLSTIMVEDVGSRQPATSSMKGLEKGNKRRGLSVSFVQEDVSKGINGKLGSSSKRKLTRHSTQRNLDQSLINSLNSSPYGELEQRYGLARGSRSFERLAAGGDPRLGYDWIAGLLDTSGTKLCDKDEEYFSELDEFRRVNYDECHRPKEVL